MRQAHPVGSEWWRAESQAAGSDAPRASVAAMAEATQSPVPFWALMGFTVILLLAPQRLVPALEPYRVGLITAGIATITYLYDRLRRQQSIAHLTREMWIAVCLLGWAFLTVPFSYWPGGSLSFLVGEYLKTLVVFWLLGNVANTTSRLRHVAWGLSLMAVPISVTAVDHYLAGVFVPEFSDPQTKRIIGYEAPLTANPNDLALTLNLIIPLSVALILSSRRPVVRFLLLAMIALNVGAIILTYSRTGFLTLATTVLLYLWKLRGKPERVWVWGALILACLCIPLLPSSYLNRISTITSIESDATGSSQARWRDMAAAADLVLKNPIIGVGVGSNAFVLNEERGRYWTEVHNVYLEYAVELGLPGLVLFLILVASCIKKASFVRQCSAPLPAFGELFSLAEGIQVSLVAWAVAAMFHPGGYHFSFYYFAGLAVALQAAYEAEKRTAGADRPEQGETGGIQGDGL